MVEVASTIVWIILAVVSIFNFGVDYLLFYIVGKIRKHSTTSKDLLKATSYFILADIILFGIFLAILKNRIGYIAIAFVVSMLFPLISILILKYVLNLDLREYLISGLIFWIFRVIISVILPTISGLGAILGFVL